MVFPLQVQEFVKKRSLQLRREPVAARAEVDRSTPGVRSSPLGTERTGAGSRPTGQVLERLPSTAPYGAEAAVPVLT